MIINSCAKRCIICLHSNVPILQLHTKKMDAPIIKHASCGYSCCCSVGRLVVIPPISRSSRSGLSSHVSFRSLVLTWCVRGEGENGRWLWYDIYDLWLLIATTFENKNDSCKNRLYLWDATTVLQEGQPPDCLSWMRWQFLLLVTTVQVIRPGTH